MNKKKGLIISVTLFLVFFVIDRFTLMPVRAKQFWVQESGRNLGDPIAYKQSFEMDGSKIMNKRKVFLKFKKIEKVAFILLDVILVHFISRHQ
ncbi:hypothetical protein [Flavobacterium microcysteis]|uniref:Uncharacterized protein n=1 Tax=Flavobacterium microcysteis TaxID=2596891 RepID=A0A501QMP8_9FLAO|nr:hypothetical protein [Flavobacterium microcysteis]TPD73744.1 hypothetical protein FJA49_00170 [Flavobacterium microcysteis]